MNPLIHRLVIPISFPDGVSPGAGRDGNRSLLAMSGRGIPVLRGTAIAGALRHAWEHAHPNDDSSTWFGSPAGTDAHDASPLRILDAPIAAATEQRMHNALDRHRGSVQHNALFTVASLAPGCRTNFILTLASDKPPLVVEHVKIFLGELVALIADGLSFGGSTARGIGQAALTPNAKAKLRTFDLTNLDQHGEWLDEQRQLAEKTPDSGTPIDPVVHPSSRLKVVFKLGVAPGQDLLIGGLNLDGVLDQQQCIGADGKDYYRIPGSSLKGVFRSWCSRLAAREGLPVANNVQRLATALPHESTKAADPGWGFVDEPTRKKWTADPSLVTCPILRLFGSLYARGRLRCSDARMPKSAPSANRAHVSIDRISGGASEGLLFNTRVLDSSPTPFEFALTIDAPSEQEARWVAQTLKAIDLGVLRLGATKAAGRLKLAEAPKVSGPHAQLFANLAPTGGVQ
jgi:CRISPR/Cas system CSM-associated protein Csm3 (group 7 of RAMP superfamily)